MQGKFRRQLVVRVALSAIIIAGVFNWLLPALSQAETASVILAGDALYSLPSLPRGVALADFNQDDVLDILCIVDESFRPAGDVVILPGLGQGAFGAPFSFPAGRGVQDFVIEDFDRDGKPDLAVLAAVEPRVFIYRNLTPAHSAVFSFQQTQSLRILRRDYTALVKGDMDGDGWTDLYLWNPAVPELLPFQSRRQTPQDFPSFHQMLSFSPLSTIYASSVVVWDLNQSGRSDLVLLKGDPVENFHELEIYQGVLPATAEAPWFVFSASAALTSYPDQILAGQLQEDDPVTLLVSGDFQRRMELFLSESGQEKVSPWLELETGTKWTLGRFLLEDLNQSGRLDILDPQPRLYHQVADQPEPFQVKQQPALQGNRFAAADLNEDGLLDLVAGMGTQPFVGVFLSTQENQFGNSLAMDLGGITSRVAAGDMDQDGRTDLAVGLQQQPLGADRLVILRSIGGGSLEPAGEIALAGRLEQMHWHDLTGDTLPELIVLQSSPDEIQIYGGIAEGKIQLDYATATALRPREFALQDMDGDGLCELAMVHDGSFSTNELPTFTLYRGMGDTAFLQVSDLSVSGDPLMKRLRRPVVADFDRDGFADLAVLNTTHHDATDWMVFYGDGSLNMASFSRRDYSLGEDWDAVDFNALDLDGDGWQDLVFSLRTGFGFVLGEGEKQFDSLQFYPSQQDILFGGLVHADFRRRGMPDFIEGSAGVLTVHQGSQTSPVDYSERQYYTGGAKELAVGDFDGDGWDDVASVDGRYLRILMNRTSGEPTITPTPTTTMSPTPTITFTPTVSPSPTSTLTPTPTPTATPGLRADFNSDSRVDEDDLLQLLKDRREDIPYPVSDLDGDSQSSPGDLFLFGTEWYLEI